MSPPPSQTATPEQKAASIRDLKAGGAFYARAMLDLDKSQTDAAAAAVKKAKQDIAIARMT